MNNLSKLQSEAVLEFDKKFMDYSKKDWEWNWTDGRPQMEPEDIKQFLSDQLTKAYLLKKKENKMKHCPHCFEEHNKDGALCEKCSKKLINENKMKPKELDWGESIKILWQQNSWSPDGQIKIEKIIEQLLTQQRTELLEEIKKEKLNTVNDILERVNEYFKYDLIPVQTREESPNFWKGYEDLRNKIEKELISNITNLLNKKDDRKTME